LELLRDALDEELLREYEPTELEPELLRELPPLRE
jgi:hypothetical protein